MDKKIDNIEDLKAYMKANRSKDMLTVQDLIDFLKTCNPKACILGYEVNSDAYIEQLKELPNSYICTVKDDKVKEKENLQHWYRGYPQEEIDKKVKEKMDTIYRYSEDDDVIIRF